jgi:general secretion pathway protein I
MRTQRAFTLLEAVIALAIFAMGATALYGWVNSNLFTLSRADQITQRASAVESAIEYMSMVDPELQPQGETLIGSLRISWRTAPPTYSADVLDEQNQKTINRASIYPATIVLMRDGKTFYQFEMSLLGVKKVRDINDVIFN